MDLTTKQKQIPVFKHRQAVPLGTKLGTCTFINTQNKDPLTKTKVGACGFNHCQNKVHGCAFGQ